MGLGEFDIIARYFTLNGGRGDVLLGIGDDAAVVATPSDRRLVVALDTIVENIHFPAGTSAADIGYRALAVNLSDLAAMGADPAWMTLSLSLSEPDAQWLEGFSSGLFELARRYNVALIGGDTVRGPMVISVQIAGLVENDRWLTRSGARAGDLIYISGTPGEAAAGLALIQQGRGQSPAGDHLRRRFLRPEPRVALGRLLRPFATAAMDISDGLLTDLDKLCSASHCGAQIDVGSLPASPAMQEFFDENACIEFALAGGDDYELLFTIDPAEAHRVPASCTRIGRIESGATVACRRNGEVFGVRRRGYDHFDVKDGS